MKELLSSESFTRRVLDTERPIEDLLKDEAFNMYRHRLSVNDVIVVNNNERRHQLIVTQTNPFVKVDWYMDYDERIYALEQVVAGLTKGAKYAA